MLSVLDIRPRSADPARPLRGRVSRPLSAVRTRGLSARLFHRRPWPPPWWARLGQPLGRVSVRPLHDEPARGPDRTAHPGRHRAHFMVVERVRPAQRRALVARGHRQDLLFTVFNATLVVPLVTALSLSFQRSSPPLPAVGHPPENRDRAPLGCHRPDPRGHGRVQLVRPPGQSPGPLPLALPRAAPLAGGHERADGLPHAPLHSRLVPHRADPGDRAAGQRRADHDPPGHLRRWSSPSPTPIPTWASDRSGGSSSVRTSTAFTTGWRADRTSTSASR